MANENQKSLSTWDQVQFYANPTWALPADNDFIRVNQKLWSQHLTDEEVVKKTQVNLTEKHHYHSKHDDFDENECVLSVQDIIPESRLARFYGSFIYDSEREKMYKADNCDENTFVDHKNATECWMSPEVNALYRKYVMPSEDTNSMVESFSVNLDIEEKYDLSTDSLFVGNTLEKQSLTLPFEVQQPQHFTPNFNKTGEVKMSWDIEKLPEIVDTKYPDNQMKIAGMLNWNIYSQFPQFVEREKVMRGYNQNYSGEIKHSFKEKKIPSWVFRLEILYPEMNLSTILRSRTLDTFSYFVQQQDVEKITICQSGAEAKCEYLSSISFETHEEKLLQKMIFSKKIRRLWNTQNNCVSDVSQRIKTIPLFPFIPDLKMTLANAIKSFNSQMKNEYLREDPFCQFKSILPCCVFKSGKILNRLRHKTTKLKNSVNGTVLRLQEIQNLHLNIVRCVTLQKHVDPKTSNSIGVASDVKEFPNVIKQIWTKNSGIRGAELFSDERKLKESNSPLQSVVQHRKVIDNNCSTKSIPVYQKPPESYTAKSYKNAKIKVSSNSSRNRMTYKNQNNNLILLTNNVNKKAVYGLYPKKYSLKNQLTKSDCIVSSDNKTDNLEDRPSVPRSKNDNDSKGIPKSGQLLEKNNETVMYFDRIIKTYSKNTESSQNNVNFRRKHTTMSRKKHDSVMSSDGTNLITSLTQISRNSSVASKLHSKSKQQNKQRESPSSHMDENYSLSSDTKQSIFFREKPINETSKESVSIQTNYNDFTVSDKMSRRNEKRNKKFIKNSNKKALTNIEETAVLTGHMKIIKPRFHSKKLRKNQKELFIPEAVEYSDSSNRRLYSAVLTNNLNLPPDGVSLAKTDSLHSAVAEISLKGSDESRVSDMDRLAVSESHLETLEIEAIEQYNPSNESIEKRFEELERQAIDEYCGTSNSNSSLDCSQSALPAEYNFKSNFTSGSVKKSANIVVCGYHATLPVNDTKQSEISDNQHIGSVVVYSSTKKFRRQAMHKEK